MIAISETHLKSFFEEAAQQFYVDKKEVENLWNSVFAEQMSQDNESVVSSDCDITGDELADLFNEQESSLPLSAEALVCKSSVPDSKNSANCEDVEFEKMLTEIENASKRMTLCNGTDANKISKVFDTEVRKIVSEGLDHYKISDINGYSSQIAECVETEFPLAFKDYDAVDEFMYLAMFGVYHMQTIVHSLVKIWLQFVNSKIGFKKTTIIPIVHAYASDLNKVIYPLVLNDDFVNFLITCSIKNYRENTGPRESEEQLDCFIRATSALTKVYDMYAPLSPEKTKESEKTEVPESVAAPQEDHCPIPESEKVANVEITVAPTEEDNAEQKNQSLSFDEESFEMKLIMLKYMSVKELKDLAKAKGIIGYSKMKKDELLKLLKSVDSLAVETLNDVVIDPINEKKLSLEDNTVKELKEMAKACNIKGYYKMKKDELINQLAATL